MLGDKLIDKDITESVEFDFNDGECLPLTKCICGKIYPHWDFILGMGKDSATKCECGRELYFEIEIRIYEKAPNKQIKPT